MSLFIHLQGVLLGTIAGGAEPVRRAAKRDTTEEGFVEVAERCGARWEYGGPLDGWLWTSQAGWRPVECKNPNGRNRLTDSQKKFINRCLRDGAEYLIFRTEGDVLQALQAKRSA